MTNVAVLFPGQGSQSVGMGKALYGAYEAARAVFKAAEAALGWEVSHLCFEGPADELNLTARTQPAILTVSVAAWKALETEAGPETLKRLRVRTRFVAGHSLGEYTALVVGGGLRFSDAVSLVEKRGKFMQEAVPEGEGAMSAIIGLERNSVEEICRTASSVGVVSPANLNCPGQVVIAGHRRAVEEAERLAKTGGARKIIPLAVSVPSHSSLMAQACERLAGALADVSLSDLSIPLVNNAGARVLTQTEEIRQSLLKQLCAPLLWEDSIRLMMDQGVDTFVEVGPGRVLSGLVKRIARRATVLNVEDPESLKNTVERL